MFQISHAYNLVKFLLGNLHFDSLCRLSRCHRTRGEPQMVVSLALVSFKENINGMLL